MRIVLRELSCFTVYTLCVGVLLALVGGTLLVWADFDDWDVTRPDGQVDSLATYDDYLVEIKEDLVAWYAIEHNVNGSHTLPYLSRADRLTYAYKIAGTIVFDSTDGYAYRWSGSAWIRLMPKGREVSSTSDTTPTVADYDRIIVTAEVDISDFEDGVAGQIITVLCAHSSGDVVIEDATDKISLDGDGDATFDEAGDRMTLQLWDDGIWYELSRREQT